jgi:hypothetical protein
MSFDLCIILLHLVPRGNLHSKGSSFCQSLATVAEKLTCNTERNRRTIERLWCCSFFTMAPCKQGKRPTLYVQFFVHYTVFRGKDNKSC